jgi:hypothetical protein
MADQKWIVIRKPAESNSAYVGPFESQEAAEAWAAEQEAQNRQIYHIRPLKTP